MPIHHEPVLLEFFRSYLDKIKKPSVILDGTLGEGGHSKSFLELGHQVYALERDKAILNKAKQRLVNYENNFIPKLGNFSAISNIFSPTLKFDFILFDLGISKFHYFESGRGFSFMKKEPLDMRLDIRELDINLGKEKPPTSISAYQVINDYAKEKLSKIFLELGEESYSIVKKTVELIIEKRKNKPFTNTFELNEVIKVAYGKKAKFQKIHPSTKIFQALRIYLNDELQHLKKGLKVAVQCLSGGGILFVISYHSLEDKIVKNIFNSLVKKHENYNKYKTSEILKQKKREKPYHLFNKKVIVPTRDEITNNPAARSAKLRGIRKILKD